MPQKGIKVSIPESRSFLSWIALATAIISVVSATIGLMKSCSTSHDVENLRVIHDSLSKTTSSQYLSTTQQAEQEKRATDRQAERIRELEDQQRQLQQSLVKAKNTEFIRQLVLTQRKGIRDLWAKIELKGLYNDVEPNVPDFSSLREVVGLKDEAYTTRMGRLSSIDRLLVMDYTLLGGALMCQENYNKVHWRSNRDVEESGPLLRELFWKECTFCETIRQAKSLGVVTELPAEIWIKFKSTLKPIPARPIFHFAGETTWWTVFQDFDSFQYSVENK